jgi:hypothetical protein
MVSDTFRIAVLGFGTLSVLSAQGDVFSSNSGASAQAPNNGCPRGTKRFTPSRLSYDPADGCLTPGQAYMRYGRGFSVNEGDQFSGGPVIAQQPQQGGVIYNQRNEPPPYNPGYPAPTYIPNRPLNGNASANRKPVVIDWKPYVDQVGKKLDNTQAQWLPGVNPGLLSQWRKSRVRADANFTTRTDGSISDIAVRSSNPQYAAFITQLLQSQNGMLPAFPQGTTAASQRIGWSFTVNQNFSRTGSTIERR